MMVLIFLGQYILPEYTDDFDVELTRVWATRSDFIDTYTYYDNNIYINMQDPKSSSSNFAKYAMRGFFAMKYSDPVLSKESVTFIQKVGD